MEDNQGFFYPHVNKEQCVACGLCEKVCPCNHQSDLRMPLNVYAAINIDESIRLRSSSGGIFSLLAEKILKEGGIVFGARFDKQWNVVHDYTDNIDGLDVFRGSKYSQSDIGSSYIQTRFWLQHGKKVLFSGTSCQIAGLKKFLSKDYENLFTIDVVCHGVPSPKVWKNYLTSLSPLPEDITHIDMRNKSRGWSRYSYLIKNGDRTFYDDFASKSLFLQGFTWNLYLRPSCYNCPAKSGKSNSDITLADNWGFKVTSPEFDDEKGISAVIINTEKGNLIFKSLRLKYKKISLDDFLHYNESYSKSSTLSPYYDQFWNAFPREGIFAVNKIRKQIKPSIFFRVIRKIMKNN